MMPKVGLDALRDTSRKQASLAFFCEEDLPKAKLAKEFEWELMDQREMIPILSTCLYFYESTVVRLEKKNFKEQS